ncbi:sulfite exporter TauE/SafE family protein [Saccharothrix sp. AJ9571]|nr:sulfite exporter TauE/SafE family protein [Saccharothrix sp. AJ9571]
MLSLICAGAVVGLLVGLTGIGGGALLTPLLVLVFGLPPTAAVSSDLLVALGLKLTGGAVHQARGDVHWPIVLWLSAGSVPAALVGPVVTKLIGPAPALHSALKTTIGVVLLVVALVTVLAVHRWRPGGARRPDLVAVRRARTVALGAVTGLLVGFTSVGSGSIVAASLLLLYPALRMSALVATDIVQALPMVFTAAVGHAVLGDFHLPITWPLLLGGVPAVIAGSMLAPRLPARLLRNSLAVLLASTGTSLLTAHLPIILSAGAATAALAVYRTTRARKAAPEPATASEPPPA